MRGRSQQVYVALANKGLESRCEGSLRRVNKDLTIYTRNLSETWLERLDSTKFRSIIPSRIERL